MLYKLKEMAISMSNVRICDDWGEKCVVHDRELGEKVDGVYPHKKWSDVVLNDVYLDDTLFWEYEMENVKHAINDSVDQGKSIIINDRDTFAGIKESTSSYRENLGDMANSDRKWIRKKKIPQKNKKNYPTKPNIKGDEKVIKVSEKQDYFNWEINHAGMESSIVEEEIAWEKYDQDTESYSAANLYVYE